MMHPTIEKLRKGLLVSCMAVENEVLHGPVLQAGMALCAEQGGAVGLKASGKEDVAIVSRVVRIPVMGMQPETAPDGKRWITPTFAAAKGLVDAGAAVLALSALGNRTYGDPIDVLIRRIHDELKTPVMVDVSSVEEARAVEGLGADLIRPAYRQPAPDFTLLGSVAQAVDAPVVAEGGYWVPEEVVKAFELGAYCAVVGTAITRPADITKRWVKIIGASK